MIYLFSNDRIQNGNVIITYTLDGVPILSEINEFSHVR